MKFQKKREGRQVTVNRSIELPVGELQIGMFVSKLDCDWADTPFLLQGFMIESPDHIEELAKHCQTVWVDRVGNDWIQAEYQAMFESAGHKNLIHEIPAQDEHGRALEIHRESKRITKSILDEVRLGKAIDTEAAKSTVADCVDSLLRNPDAMLWMGRIREQSNYTAEHSLNVCVLAIAFGRYLGMGEQELNQLGLCALLHDVGKMQIPEEILNKPGALDDEEWATMKQHAVFGRDLLLSTPSLYHGAVDVAYSHHERVGGGGYPRGLKGAGISHYAKIISVVDAYDAMTAARCYAGAISSTEAIKILYDERSKHFDEKLVEHFMQMIGLYPPGTIVELINGEVALVLSSNYKYQQLPRVIVVLDENKQRCPEKVLNLHDIEKGKLGEECFIRKAHPDGSFGLFMRDFQDKGLQFASPDAAARKAQ